MTDVSRKDVPRTFLGMILSARARKMGLRVDTEDGEDGGVHFIRHDVIGDRSGGEWFCFSVVLVIADHSVGIWTREMIAGNQSPVAMERNYHFESDTFDKWLGEWFEDAVLEELTRP